MKWESSKRLRRLCRLLAATAALAALGPLDAPSALAGNSFGGFVGGAIGGAIGGAMGVMGGPRYNPYRGSVRKAAPGAGAAPADSGAPSAADSSRALAALAPPTTQQQQAILKAIVPSQSLGAVGASDDLDQIGKADVEGDRDYSAKIGALIARLQAAQNQQRATKEGDVTEHAILESLDAAVREANLQKFETFLGENWSPERLRVMILDRVDNEIGGLFEGTNRGAVTMSDIDSMIRKAARNVYARLFETSELLADNRGSTLFVERLYQTHGDLVSGDVRESAEQLLSEASAAGVAPLEGALRRNPDVFALRYRAERIIFDCLSGNLETISSSDSGIASPAEIGKRMLDIDHDQCAKWVAAQLIGPDGKVKAQDPVPLRVVWTADGPKDDPSMYGRAPDQP